MVFSHRATYELLDFLGDVGGLLGFLLAVFKTLVNPLGQSKITSLIANRFYTSPQDHSENQQQAKKKKIQRQSSSQIGL